MKKILEIRVLESYRVWLRFDDGVSGEVDFSGKPHTGVFSRWKDYNYFQRAKIDEDGQLVWDDQVDFSADSLWLKVIGRRPQEQSNEQEVSKVHA